MEKHLELILFIILYIGESIIKLFLLTQTPCKCKAFTVMGDNH